MEAKSFRIGNLINYRIVDKIDERQEWFEVSEIDYDDLRILGIKDETNQDYQPIPLTEEWLLKFGFEFVFGINNRYLKDYGSFCFTIMIMNDDKSYRVSLSNHKKKEGEIIPIVGLGIIKYVHQLQNLYFALTGEELKNS